jgi:hypothetical protein
VGNGRRTAATHGEQSVAGVEEGDGGGDLNSGRLKGKRAGGMRREEAGTTLEPEKKGRGGVCTGSCCDGEVADGRRSGWRGARARGPGRRS